MSALLEDARADLRPRDLGDYLRAPAALRRAARVLEATSPPASEPLTPEERKAPTAIPVVRR